MDKNLGFATEKNLADWVGNHLSVPKESVLLGIRSCVGFVLGYLKKFPDEVGTNRNKIPELFARAKLFGIKKGAIIDQLNTGHQKAIREISLEN